MADSIPRDDRNVKLYRDKPIQIPEDDRQGVLDIANEFFGRSRTWIEQNYEEDFVRYLANFRSIPGDTPKPWEEANDYFLPSTNITIENYVARFMETIRGARDFVTVNPRGRDDADKAKLVELLLRYIFEQPLDGFQKTVDVLRNKFIYGTSIAHMPYVYETHKRKVPGVYIFDTQREDFIREIPEESNIEPDDVPPPKDFSGVDIGPLLKSEEGRFVRRDVYEDVVMKDQSNLEALDIFAVKIDPAGCNDIQKHQFTIVESIETLDSIKRKVANNEYDESEVEELERFLGSDAKTRREIILSRINDSVDDRDSIEDIQVDFGIKGGVRIWTMYHKWDVNDDGWDEECITVIAEGAFLLKSIETPYQVNGIPYRPLLVDRFVTLPHRFYGIGIAEILEQLNFLLNHLTNQILNHGDLYNSPPLIYPADGQWDPAHNMFGPGQTWQSDAADGFKILETPDIKSSQINMITFVEGFLQKSLGISDFTLGGGQGSIVPNQTARGIGSVLREVNRRIDFYAQTTQDGFFKKMFEMLLKQAQAFMDETVVPKVTDMEVEFSEITNRDIQGFYDIKISADSVSASREVEQQKWLTLFQALSPIQDPNTGAPVFDTVAMAKKIFESFNEPFVENFLAANSTNPQGIPAQGQQGTQGGQPNLQVQPEAGLQELEA